MMKLAAASLFAAASVAEFQCRDATEEVNPECFKNVNWAMETGIKEHPDWYPEGTTTFVDFQCALVMMSHKDISGNGWHCELPPCSNITAEMLIDPAVDRACEPKKVKRAAAAPAPEGPSIEWWGWVLIVAGVALLGVLVAWALGMFAEKKPKKKRAIKKLEPVPEPAPTTSTAMPVYDVAPPVYTYTTPVQTYAAPPTYAAPVATSVIQQPVTMSVVQAPPVMQAPVAMPVVQAPQVVTTDPVYVTSAAPIAGVVAVQP